MSFSIVTANCDLVRLTIDGPLDHGTRAVLRMELAKVLRSKPKEVELVIARPGLFDGAGRALLLSFLELARAGGARLSLGGTDERNPTPIDLPEIERLLTSQAASRAYVIPIASIAFVACALLMPGMGRTRDLESARRSTPRWAAATDPNVYEDSVGTVVAFDQQIADRLDDGYGPHGHLQFEEVLATHGTWIETAELGRVWVPSVGETGTDFWPYRTGGHWTLTEYGWTWSSDWSWGWLPFHYGRWAFLPDHGWCWVPGTLWGPAWVAWRQGKAYIAWAPLPPRGMNLGRPLGRMSPWWMVKARTLGRDADFVARRQIPALFSLTTPVRNPRTLTIEGLAVRISAGPRQSCCGFRVRPARLSEAVPRALPAFVVHPRPGAAVADRPWVRSGFVDQTPLCRWAEPGKTEDTAACRPGRSIPDDPRLKSHAATSRSGS
jgi:ABC-type transporter Mla MlaB component